MSRLASAHDLGGFVHNDGEGVWIEIEGSSVAIARFVHELPAAAPALACIEGIETREVAVRGETTFAIAESPQNEAGGDVMPAIPADLASCPDCLRELADPHDRRFRYPFINCTACGPRFSIVREVPYDRERTTMDAFVLCARCAREYGDPRDRRYHAEPNACPACGPQLSFLTAGHHVRGPAALRAAVDVLQRGGIVAVKGMGGFVLAADATHAQAVAELRRRKGRPHKPFAVMARDLDSLTRCVRVDAPARAALLSPARPIVLCPRRPEGPLAAEVAPGLDEVGCFLPPTPLQALLLAEGPPLQIMTSGNRSEEPIAKDNDDALVRLAPLADAFLLHDRTIHTRVDDSVARVIAGVPRLLRRARGFVPGALALPTPRGAPVVLAVGAQMKATVCLASGGKAVLSQHLGELGELETFRFFEETIGKLQRLLGLEPQAIAHDLHPDCRSTRWARARGLPLFPVQHHHAHIAACLAEHGRSGPALGVAFDGTGYGVDGSMWGGELLEADLGSFVRRAHLRALPLPGGEAAIRQPWRLALAALADAEEPLELLPGVPALARQQLAWLLRASGPRARTSAAGRWFDAVAALCGLREVSYEGQAPCELEALAAAGDHGHYPFALTTEPLELADPIDGQAPFEIDLRPTVQAIAAELRAGLPVALIAARFHDTLAEAIRAACRRARNAGGPSLVALAGGCFVNRRLAERTMVLLERDGFEVLLPARVPAGDGGLSFGQAAVASVRAGRDSEGSRPCA